MTSTERERGGCLVAAVDIELVLRLGEGSMAHRLYVFKSLRTMMADLWYE